MKKMSRNAAPLSLAQPLFRITAPLLSGTNALWAHLCLNWESIAGDRWGARTCPTRLVFPTDRQPKGILHLSTWGGLGLALAYEAPYLCEKVNQYFGYAAVHQIKWRTIASPAAKTSPPPTWVRTPLKASEQKWLGETTKTVDNPALKAALWGLGEAFLQRHGDHASCKML